MVVSSASVKLATILEPAVSGRPLRGTVSVEVAEAFEEKSLAVQLTGLEETAWEELISGKDRVISGTDTFYEVRVVLHEWVDGLRCEPGTYTFPFELPLPASRCLPSFYYSEGPMKRVDARRNISAAVKYELVVTVDHAAPVQRPKTSRKSLFAKSASFVKRGDSAVAPRSSGSATVTANRSSKSLYSNGSATHARAEPLGITRRELVVRPASRAQGGSYAPTAHSPGPSPSGATAASAPLPTIALPSPAGGPASSGPHSVALPQLSTQTSEESPRPEPEPKPIDEADVTRVFTLSDSCSCYLSDSGSVRMRLQVDRDVCKPGGTLVITTEAEAVNTYIAFPRLTVECGELVLLQAAPSQEGGKHQPPQVECFKPFWRHELAGLYPKLFARVLKRSARGGAPCRLMVPLPMELQPSLHGRLIQRCVAVQLTASPDETCLIATRPRVLARIAVV